MSNFKQQSCPMPVTTHIYRLAALDKPNTLFKKLHVVIVIVLSFLFCRNAFAQQEKIDSLKNILPLLKDSARVNCLNALGEAYIAIQIDTTLLFAEQALKEAEKINYIAGEGEAYYNLAQVNSEMSSDFPKMEENAYKAVILLNKVDNKKQQANAYTLLGNAYEYQSKFSLSIEAYKKALELFYALHDYSSISDTYVQMGGTEEDRGHYEQCMQYSIASLEMSKKDNDELGLTMLANLYSHVGDYTTALEYYRQAYSEAKTNKNEFPLNYTCGKMGETFFLQRAYDSAKLYYNLSIEYTLRNNYNLSIEYTLRNNGIALNTEELKRRGILYKPYARLGELYLALHKYDTALIYLNNALDYFTKANDRNQVMWVLLRLSKLYHEKKDYERALQNAQQLLQISNETGARHYIRDAHFQLYQLFEHLQKEDSAFLHLRLYTVLKDSIDIDLSAQKLAFYRVQSEREKAQLNINLLNKEKQLQQQQLQQSAQQKKFLAGGIAALLIIGFFLFRNNILKRRNEKQRLEHELELHRLESEKTKSELQHQASELEMQALRAQMNPHFIFNSLNSINRFILQNNKAEASEYLTKFSKLVRMILQNSQASLISLESELESLSLYLEMEALRFNNYFTYKISVQKDIDAEVLKVPPLIIQPYVENAIWHGLMHKEETGELNIDISSHEDHLYFRITDNGIGRKKAAALASKSATKHKSMGLRITAQRIAMIQSMNAREVPVSIVDLTYPDGSAAGTEVTIKMPEIYD